MKKMVLALAAAVLLLGGTMRVYAYDTTVDGMQCYCSITAYKDVMAYTAVGSTSTTVIIRSTAYDKDSKSIGSNGNAGGGYASTKYTASDIIYYTVQVHEVPSYGASETLVQFAYPY